MSETKITLDFQGTKVSGMDFCKIINVVKDIIKEENITISNANIDYEIMPIRHEAPNCNLDT